MNKNNNKKIFLIANLNLKNNKVEGGMIAKNIILFNYLKKKYNSLVVFDSFRKGNDLIKKIYFYIYLFISIITRGIFSKLIILSEQSDAAYKIIKLLYFLKISHKTIYMVIGGNFQNRIADEDFEIKFFMKIKKICVESLQMKNKLDDLNFQNVSYIPNFKNTKIFEKISLKNYNNPLKLYYIGRVDPEKGIEFLIECLEKININETLFTLDIFGTIKNDYRNDFYRRLKKNNFVSYNGKLDLVNNQSDYIVLLNYDIFIFPTSWTGEGFPGVLLDAFIIGSPIICSDWGYNQEIIKDGYNGIIFKTQSCLDLQKKLIYIYENPKILNELSHNSKQSSLLYDVDKVLKSLDDLIIS